MDFDINEYIRNEMYKRNIQHFKVEPVYYDIGSEFFSGAGENIKPTGWGGSFNPYIRKFLKLNNDIFLFVNQDVDAHILTLFELIGQDNYFVFTKSLLQNTFMAQYQFFTGELEIKVSRIPNPFIYPRLEFLRITPEYTNYIKQFK